MQKIVIQLALVSWALIIGGTIVFKMFHIETSGNVDVNLLPEGKHFALTSDNGDGAFNATLYVKAPDKVTGAMKVSKLDGIISGLDSNYSGRLIDFKAVDSDCLSSRFQLLYLEDSVQIMQGFGEVAARACHMFSYLKDTDTLNRVAQ